MIAKQFGTTGREVARIGQGTWQHPRTRASRRGGEARASARHRARHDAHRYRRDVRRRRAPRRCRRRDSAGLPREQLVRREQGAAVERDLRGNAARVRALAASAWGSTTSTAICCIGAARIRSRRRCARSRSSSTTGKIRALGVSNFDVEDLRGSAGRART